MIFREFDIPGALEVLPEARGDARGSFERIFCAEEFRARGLATRWVQMNLSVTRGAGTLRGMHFQRPPHAEVKLIRAIRGRVHDVIVDLRAGSPSFGRHVAVVLDADLRNAVYVPEGFAHGFQTLTDEVEMIYAHSAAYAPDAEGGVQALDPALGIDWPRPVTQRSPRDEGLPGLGEVVALNLSGD